MATSASLNWIFSNDEYVQVMIKKNKPYFPILQQEREARNNTNIN